jgi:ribosomal-protein-alanine N-acetyltransferase
MVANIQNLNEELQKEQLLKDPASKEAAKEKLRAMVEIRTMFYSDLKQVIEIEKKAYPHPWTLGIFRDCLRVGYKAWVMTLDDSIIGYGIVMLSPGEAHILNICIDPDYQAKGLGRYLLQYLVENASKVDVDMVLLEVRRSNTDAHQLYQSEGFHELGVRKDYYPAEQGREDAIILAKYISPDSDSDK